MRRWICISFAELRRLWRRKGYQGYWKDPIACGVHKDNVDADKEQFLALERGG